MSEKEEERMISDYIERRFVMNEVLQGMSKAQLITMINEMMEVQDCFWERIEIMRKERKEERR